MSVQRKPVSYWRLIRRLGLLWLIVPALVALVFGSVGVSITAKNMTLARDGVVTEGIVLDRQIERRRTSNGGSSTHHYVTYSYRPEGHHSPEDIVHRHHVGGALYARLQVGGPVQVTYVASQPETASIDISNDRIGGWFFGVFGLVAGLIALGLGGWMLGRKLSVIRALRHGEVREARVTGIRPTNVQKNKRTQYVLHWQDAMGEEGKSMMDDFNTLARHPTGSVIVVYVDPRTGRGWWEDQI